MNDDYKRIEASLQSKFICNREGSSCRRSWELSEVFISDARDLLKLEDGYRPCIHCDLDVLSSLCAYCRESLEENAWCEPDGDGIDRSAEYVEKSLDSVVRQHEESLNAKGYSVVWNDGFVIYKDLTDEEAEYANQV